MCAWHCLNRTTAQKQRACVHCGGCDETAQARTITQPSRRRVGLAHERHRDGTQRAAAAAAANKHHTPRWCTHQQILGSIARESSRIIRAAAARIRTTEPPTPSLPLGTEPSKSDRCRATPNEAKNRTECTCLIVHYVQQSRVRFGTVYALPFAPSSSSGQ